MTIHILRQETITICHSGGKACSNSRAEIGDNNRLQFTSMLLKIESSIKIGDKNTVAARLIVAISEYTSVEIGNDNMFSTDIIIQSSDGHSIFDVVERKNINTRKEIARKRKITIGNHIWIGRRVVLMANATIKDGSVIGINSFVKGEIPNNCIAVGTPARVIRKNISWCRANVTENITECGEEYINLTEE